MISTFSILKEPLERTITGKTKHKPSICTNMQTRKARLVFEQLVIECDNCYRLTLLANARFHGTASAHKQECLSSIKKKQKPVKLPKTKESNLRTLYVTTYNKKTHALTSILLVHVTRHIGETSYQSLNPSRPL